MVEILPIHMLGKPLYLKDYAQIRRTWGIYFPWIWGNFLVTF